ncbi:protein of unknown function [Fontimonas thermophila]|uniref:DUF4382 domain-containing protein n=1 Tax=Fontimonas thermophila TaxID=1076937 RepID=A0A1I2KCD9_9GAMM|nr:DUF4382 domain-containing protein [Fontimonas thermophila]SFF62887.1 protein of unknown function [Fontimonas thermophila]
MPNASRLCLVAVTLLLCACESELSIDLTDAPIDGATRVQLAVSAVELLGSDGTVTRIDSQYTDDFDMLDYRDGERLRLVDASGELKGRHVGLRLRLDDDNAFLRKDEDSTPIELLSAGEYATVDLDLDDGDARTLIVDLDLRFSLIDRRDTLGVYQMIPVIRVIDADRAGRIEGTIDANAIADADCRDGRAIGTGVAVYLYTGTGVTPGDYDADATVTPLAQPLAAADVREDAASGAWTYRFHYVQPGRYTLAWTCEADREHPQQDDDLSFRDAADVEVGEAQTVTVNF